MTAPSVQFHPEAVEEAAAAAQWYRERSTIAASAFLSEVDRAIESISERPEAWLPYMFGTRRFLLRRFPYFVVYRDAQESIQIVAVAHARRKPGYWKTR